MKIEETQEFRILRKETDGILPDETCRKVAHALLIARIPKAQREVFDAIGEGRTVKQISEHLCMNSSLVAANLQHLLKASLIVRIDGNNRQKHLYAIKKL